jgi:hypothetical protein
MAKMKNYHYHSDPNTIARLADEYRFIGREVEVPEPDHIVVLALPRKKVKQQQEEKAEKEKTSRKNTYRASK